MLHRPSCFVTAVTKAEITINFTYKIYIFFLLSHFLFCPPSFLKICIILQNNSKPQVVNSHEMQKCFYDAHSMFVSKPHIGN